MTHTPQELERLMAEATPGPWEVGQSHHEDVHWGGYHAGSFKNVNGSWAPMGLSEADAALICAAVNSLPALLAEIERLRVKAGES